MGYRAPLTDIRFIFDHVIPLATVSGTERFAEATPDLAEAILTEAAKLCDEVLAPVQRSGDLSPARLENGVVRTSPGFAEAYGAIRDGGWVSVGGPVEYGGMGLPQSLNMAIQDMMAGACLSLQLAPLMSIGQAEALDHHASDALKALYLPKLMSGEWVGTMNLTEPQAGSDVGALRTRAEPNGDGTYAITGQKIFISWGDNDFTENVSHLVLARLPGGRDGVKGISLFLVPRNIPDADGKPGKANNLKVVSLEHKMGLHGSPTCVMSYDGATGWLVGQEHNGMAAMFTMMNNARLGVGMQGIGVAEAACQAAVAYAAERQQFGPILDHADVRRMLAEMRADVFAARAIGMACAQAIDMATATGDGDWSARAAFLTPIAKAFGTETGIRVSETAVQVHGGMGFIEETGVAQFSRDVRVTAIYEGTNGIQAMDMVGRKLADGGDAAGRILDEIEEGAEAARSEFPALAEALWSATESLREATEWMVAQKPVDRQAGALAYLRAFARVLGGHFHLRAALAEGAGGHRAALASFYINRLLPQHVALLAEAQCGAEGVFAVGAKALES
ncbi:MAG: acyl-CoA dehydrogenase [Rhodobacteraceae bacterium]|nr:acyl-CoA dehydrogenase [Paracoccaceae bacterium]